MLALGSTNNVLSAIATGAMHFTIVEIVQCWYLEYQ
jgi:hypothetical protein